jgi:hypothetical protein
MDLITADNLRRKGFHDVSGCEGCEISENLGINLGGPWRIPSD